MTPHNIIKAGLVLATADVCWESWKLETNMPNNERSKYKYLVLDVIMSLAACYATTKILHSIKIDNLKYIALPYFFSLFVNLCKKEEGYVIDVPIFNKFNNWLTDKNKIESECSGIIDSIEASPYSLRATFTASMFLINTTRVLAVAFIWSKVRGSL